MFDHYVLAPFLGLIVAAATAGPATAQSTSQPIAIANVTVVDVEHGVNVSNQTVLIDAGHIRFIGSAARTPVPRNATVVDGRGKYLIPGLWDMHVHIFGNVEHIGQDSHALSFPLFLANGVTGVRDMWTDFEDQQVIRQWRAEAAAGRMLAPIVIPTSTPVDGPEGQTLGNRETSPKFTSPELARHFVDSMVAGGARMIKILHVSRDVYFAAIDEARKRGAEPVGHVPSDVHAIEASDAGLRSLEHFQGVLEGCATAEPTLDSVRAGGRNQNVRQRLVLSTYSDARCDTVAAHFIRNNTWQDPTAAMRSRQQHADDPAVMSDPRLRYVAPEDTAAWHAFAMRSARADTTRKRLEHEIDALRTRIIGRMYRARVPMLIGTDLGNPFAIAGFTVHDEMAIPVRGGATAAQVLRAATLNPAIFLGATDSLGTVAVNKRADLVLLDADPLADIDNANRIRAVFVGGRLLDRAALDHLLETAARVAPQVWKSK